VGSTEEIEHISCDVPDSVNVIVVDECNEKLPKFKKKSMQPYMLATSLRTTCVVMKGNQLNNHLCCSSMFYFTRVDPQAESTYMYVYKLISLNLRKYINQSHTTNLMIDYCSISAYAYRARGSHATSM